MAVDASGNVYVTVTYSVDPHDYRVLKFSSSGSFITKWGSGGSGDGQFSTATGIAVDSTGKVYVADYDDWNVQMFSPDASASPVTPLYFPHVDTSLPWQTEIAVINTSDQTVTGTLRGLSDEGQLVETKLVSLYPHGGRQITVANEFTSHTGIGYIVFDADSDGGRGLHEVLSGGDLSSGNSGGKRSERLRYLYRTHRLQRSLVDRDKPVEHNVVPKELTITFNNGQSRQIPLAANQHTAFTIASLFNNQPQPDIRSAVITNASGIIGLELFGSTGGGSQLDGLLLNGNTATTLYYPHVAGDGWWTGIVAYNPSESACSITITPYSAQGVPFSSLTQPLAGKERYVGLASELGLPAGTAWFKIDSTRPLTGFELFGTTDGKQLAAYAGGVGTGAKSGVLPKVEKNGWTGIVFVNTEPGAASVTLTAYNEMAAAVATQMLSIGGYAKVVNYAENDLHTEYRKRHLYCLLIGPECRSVSAQRHRRRHDARRVARAWRGELIPKSA